MDKMKKVNKTECYVWRTSEVDKNCASLYNEQAPDEAKKICTVYKVGTSWNLKFNNYYNFDYSSHVIHLAGNYDSLAEAEHAANMYIYECCTWKINYYLGICERLPLTPF